MIFRLRNLLVGQRTQTINALRGHLAEFGLIAGKGRENIDKLRAALEPGHDGTKDLPPAVHHMAQLCFDQIDDLSRRIAELDAQIAAASKRSPFSARLQKMPGVGPVTAECATRPLRSRQPRARMGPDRLSGADDGRDPPRSRQGHHRVDEARSGEEAARVRRLTRAVAEKATQLRPSSFRACLCDLANREGPYLGSGPINRLEAVQPT